MVNLAIFGSGRGSNARRIISHFRAHDCGVRICVLLSNRPERGFGQIAEDCDIPLIDIRGMRMDDPDIIGQLKDFGTDWIALAGFLRLIPAGMIEEWPQRIVNIHPALLPDYGGQGMYGMNVHEAVIAAGEAESGISIHFVDGHYDNGDLILQERLEIYPGDTAQTLAARIHELEHRHYPVILQELLTTG